MKQELGIVTMSYNEQGEIDLASFTPTMSINLSEELFKELRTLTGKKDEIVLKHNAESVFALWFSKTNEIELADRDRYEIVSEVIECLKYPNGQVRECKLRFIFQPLKNKMLN